MIRPNQATVKDIVSDKDENTFSVLVEDKIIVLHSTEIVNWDLLSRITRFISIFAVDD